MSYKRIMSNDTKQKISNSLKGRKLTPDHIEKIRQGVKKAWQRVPLDPNNEQGSKIMLDVYTDNYGNKKVYHNGQEIKNEI